MKVKRLVAGAMVFASAALLAACGSKSSSSSSETFNRMEKDVISTMDNAHITDVISGQAAVDTGDGLYRYKGKKLEPAVATKVVSQRITALLIHSTCGRRSGVTAILLLPKISSLRGSEQQIRKLSQNMLIFSLSLRTRMTSLLVRRLLQPLVLKQKAIISWLSRWIGQYRTLAR